MTGAPTSNVFITVLIILLCYSVHCALPLYFLFCLLQIIVPCARFPAQRNINLTAPCFLILRYALKCGKDVQIELDSILLIFITVFITYYGKYTYVTDCWKPSITNVLIK